MRFPFYIARRYLFSKKKTNIINLISIISVSGAAVATMALIIVLSVFNGFSDMVASLLTNFDPELKIVATEGKSVAADDPILTEIRNMDEVDIAAECYEDQALAIYGDRQATVMVKGVEDNFNKLCSVDDILYGSGQFQLHAGILNYAIPGVMLAQDMGMNARYNGYLKIYAPRREGQLNMSNPVENFSVDSLMSAGVVFMVNQSRYDKDYLLTSIHFARNLFEGQGMLTSLELKLKNASQLNTVKKKMRKIGGDKFRVLDRYEQQPDTFRVMQIEKLLAYLFLTFILMVACFNIFGTLSMLMIDKRDDVTTLRNLGATNSQITRIFQLEGWMISALGAVIGIALGLLLCYLQQTVGLVKMGSTEGQFIIENYPVSVHATDVVIVFVTVMAVGILATWYPVKYLARRLQINE